MNTTTSVIETIGYIDDAVYRQCPHLTPLMYTSQLNVAVFKELSNTHYVWQPYYVPFHICKEMVDQIPVRDNMVYVVYFSPEFIELLINYKGINPDQIVFFTDCSKIRLAAGEIYGLDTKTPLLNRERILAFESLGHPKGFIMNIKNSYDAAAVMGNPPYHKNDGGGRGDSAQPLYNLFIDSVKDIYNPEYFTFIIPSRWMSGGKGLDEFRVKMMTDPRLKKIVHFPDSTDVFPEVSISAGVCYFLWERQYTGLCEFVVNNTVLYRNLAEELIKYDILVSDNESLGILDKVIPNSQGGLDAKVLSRKPFGITSNFSKWQKNGGVPCLCRDAEINHISLENVVDKSEVIDKYKVVVSKASDSSGRGDKDGMRHVLYSINTIPPGTVCTETYLVLDSFDTQEEAANFESYVRTKFFRFLLSLRATTQNLSKDKFKWVPSLDYSSPLTDEKLYEMFNLTVDEIGYIESKIKS